MTYYIRSRFNGKWLWTDEGGNPRSVSQAFKEKTEDECRCLGITHVEFVSVEEYENEMAAHGYLARQIQTYYAGTNPLD